MTSPSAESSTGPVKNSPSGMLCLPPAAMKVRPSIPSRRSVPSPVTWTSERPSIHSFRRSVSSDWRFQAPTGSSSVARQAP